MLTGQRELEYLKELCHKYGSQYLHKYFGFTLAEIARKIGVKPGLFSMIITGRRNLPAESAVKLVELFKEMQIEEKTINFTETSAQILTRKIVRELKTKRF